MSGLTSSNPLPGLHISLSQASTSPPTITVTIQNNNTYPVTIVSYQSPLDSLALELGQLSITPAGQEKPLDNPTIAVKRIWPPPEDCIIGITPGASAERDIVLRDPPIPMDQLGSMATVVLRGQWWTVWGRSREEISQSDLENSSSSPDVFSGDYESNSLDISIS